MDAVLAAHHQRSGVPEALIRTNMLHHCTPCSQHSQRGAASFLTHAHPVLRMRALQIQHPPATPVVCLLRTYLPGSTFQADPSQGCTAVAQTCGPRACAASH